MSAVGTVIATPAGPNSIASSRRVVASLLFAVIAVSTAFAALAPITLGGDDALFALPVLIHNALLCTAVLCMVVMRTGLRVDSFTFFIAWETLRGSVAPVILMYVGSGTRFFYRLGTPSDSRTVLLMGSLFFTIVLATRISVAVASSRRQRTKAPAAGLGTNRPLTVGEVSAWPLIVIGLVGLVLRFPSPGAVALFFSGSVEGLQGNGQFSDGPLLLAANFLRPMLIVGLVVLIRSRRSRGLRWWPLVPVTGIAALFALASYGLNRGTIAYCLVALALVYFEKSGLRLRFGAVIVTVGAFGAFFALVGQLRSTIWSSRTGLDSTGLDFISVLQSVLPYAATPNQLSAALPVVEQSDPFGWHSFAMSLLSPVPGAPEASRTESGTALFNNIIYHSFIGKDQLLPSWFEGWVTFGIIGLVGMGIAVGLLLALADVFRRTATTEIGMYAATIFALWIPQASVTAVGVIEQNVIYFVATPFFITLIVRLWPRTSPRSSTDDPFARGPRPSSSVTSSRKALR